MQNDFISRRATLVQDTIYHKNMHSAIFIENFTIQSKKISGALRAGTILKFIRKTMYTEK